MKFISCILVLVYALASVWANIEGGLLELEAIVKVRLAENEKLRSRVIELENEYAELTAVDLETEGVEQQEGLGTNKRGQLSEGIGSSPKHASRRATTPAPAFHAYLSTSKCHNNRETIIFDAEALDLGGFGDVGVYDKKDGIFEPPTSGVYVLAWTIASSNMATFTTELVISGGLAGVTTTDSDNNPDNVGHGIHPATAMVVVNMAAGTHCFLRIRHHNNNCVNVLSDNDSVRTTFSAWKLFHL